MSPPPDALWSIVLLRVIGAVILGCRGVPPVASLEIALVPFCVDPGLYSIV